MIYHNDSGNSLNFSHVATVGLKYVVLGGENEQKLNGFLFCLVHRFMSS